MGTTIFLALCGAVLIGAADVLGGVASRQRSAIAVSGWLHVVAFGAVVPVAIVRGAGSVSQRDVLLGCACGLFDGISYTCYLAAIGRGRMAVVTPIVAGVGTGLPVLLSLARGEHLPRLALVGVAMAVLAIPVIAAAGEDASVQNPWPLRRQVAVACFTGVGVGLYFFLMGQTASASGSWPVVVSLAIGSLVCVAWLAGQRAPLGPPTVAVASVGLAAAAGDLALGASLQRGPVAIASVLGNLYPLVVALLAVVILHERIGRLQACGIAAGLAGVALLSVAA